MQALLDAAGAPKLKWQDRIPKYQLAVRAAIRLKDLLGESVALVGEGKCFDAQKRPTEAEACYDKALGLYRITNGKPGEADTLDRIGEALANLGLVRRALREFERELTVRLTISDRKGKAAALHNIGSVYCALGQKRKALDYYNRALAIRRKVRDRSGEAATLDGIAGVWSALGQKQKSLDYYNRALAIRRKVRDRSGEAATLDGIGGVWSDLGQKQKALDYFARALPIRRRVKDRRGEATTLDNIGSVYSDLEKLPKALHYFAAALPITTEVGDRSGEATTLNNIGAVYDHLGKNQKALDDYYAKALAIEMEIGDRSGEAETLLNIGSVYSALGQNQKAFDYFKRALPITREVEDPFAEATALHNIGSVYSALGQNQKALDDYYAKALAIRRQVGDRKGEAATLGNMGSAYYALDQKQKALAFFVKALPIRRQVGDRSGEAATLGNIGAAYYALDQKQKALAFFVMALPIIRQAGDLRGEDASLHNIGAIYSAIGQKQKALGYYASALAIETEIGDPTLEAATLNNIGRTNYALGRRTLAIIMAKRSVIITQALRANITGLDEESRRSYRDSVAQRYRRLADWLAEAGRLAEAEQVMDLLKDEEFFGFLRVRGVKSETVDLSPREKAWMQQYNKLGEGLAAYAFQHEALKKIETRTELQQKRLKELDLKLTESAAAFNEFVHQTEVAFKAAGADMDRVHDMDQAVALQRMLLELPSHPALLYTLETSDGVRVIFSVPGLAAPRQAKKGMVTAVALNKMIFAFREALTDPNLDPRPLGADLYDLLVRPIEQDLTEAKVETLMWSLDGPLRYLPFCALYDREARKYLIEKYPTSLFTPRMTEGLKDKPHPWIGAEFGVIEGGSVGDISFGRLPGVAGELAGVHKSLSGPPPLVDSAFTYSAFTDALYAQPAPTVVHVATHFRFKPNDDRGSFLLLGRGETISLERLNNMPGAALGTLDLLVLSACETEMGGDANGSEFEGFARLAQEKGAGAVLATLWQVSDESTGLLMSEFYRLHQANPGWTKLAALSGAQREMLQGDLGPVGNSPARAEIAHTVTRSAKAPPWPAGLPKYAHPYYWAPFVLTGNWL